MAEVEANMSEKNPKLFEWFVEGIPRSRLNINK